MAWVTKDSPEQYAPQEPEREYTKQEKAANWWHYNKWIVLAVIVGVVMIAWIVKDTVFQTKPDYQVGFVGHSELPVDTAAALTNALQELGTDVNHDGKVVVQLNQFTVNFDEGDETTDAYYQMAGVTKLTADLSSNGTYLFLLEDPEGFEAATEALRYLDGTMPNIDDENADLDWREMVYRWSDCPALTALDLGSYTGLTLLDEQTGENQDVLANLYVGRRGIWNDKSEEEQFPGWPSLWDTLTAGATSTAGTAK